MVHTIRTLQAIFGLAILVIFLGWCLWRLAGWTGLIRIKQKKHKQVKEPLNDSIGNRQKTAPVNISKKAYYSAKRNK